MKFKNCTKVNTCNNKTWFVVSIIPKSLMHQLPPNETTPQRNTATPFQIYFNAFQRNSD